MPYIDQDYYSDIYKGKLPNESVSLDKTTQAIQRASDIIDILIGYKFKTKEELDKSHPFVKQQIMKATAFLTEYYIINGGYEVMQQNGAQSASVGSFKFTNNFRSASENSNDKKVPDEVFEMLAHAGLLYSGIDSGGCYL